MKTTNTTLKTLTIALLAGLGLAGCVPVPVHGGARAYGPPVGPAIVVRPFLRPYYGYPAHRGGYYGGPRARW